MINKGSCLCARIQYEIDGELDDVLNCHCSMCRKLHASAFRTRAKIKTDSWKIICGEELIKFYESSPGEHKGFCSECGSSLLTRFDHHPDILGFPLGTLDTDPKVTPTRHVYVAHKAAWHEISDALPQLQEFEK
ncbi:GFA family protein [Shewanella surugensis]|uniref:GFA family protein n=1 Tax=Shewanella surugensis TaxID=212020 RepID=A0ABT0L6B2_9GAMM|nr:GFA family protein [Shewanella surugensis]MCL1123226.1 GFA family protein [Shewanella surugensis]